MIRGGARMRIIVHPAWLIYVERYSNILEVARD